MPKETVAAVLETEQTPAAPVSEPVPPQEMTGLPDRHNPGTVAEMLTLRKKQPKEELKPEEVEKNKKLEEVDKKLQDMLFKGKPKKKAKEEPEPAVEDEEAISTVAAPPAPDPEPRPEPAKAPTKKVVVKDRATALREQELELDRQRLALERERLDLEKNKSKSKEPVVDLSALSSDERYELEVFQAMGKMDAKYADLASRFTDVAKATTKYKQEWEKANPGESFDPDDSAHDSFFNANQVKYDKRDFKRAEHRLATEGVEDPKLKELEKSNQELKAQSKLQELGPKIFNTWLNKVDAMIEAIDPDIAVATRKAGKDAGEVLKKDFPEEGEEILRAAEALGSVAQEAYKILDGDGLFIPDTSNRVHARILDIIRKQEQIIPRQAREDRLVDGKDFATWEQWLNMNDSERDMHWHLGAEEVIDIESSNLAGRVKYEIDRALKIAESRQKRTSGVKNQEQVPAVVKEKTPERRSPAASPGSASKTTVDISARPHESGDDKLTKIIRMGLFKRAS